ncbi:MAG: DUF2779 domain-containing protein [Helicobacteraceae bacterium]|nr:DUF2779 domain-containing protein [Helicobacteraceae bacterium]
MDAALLFRLISCERARSYYAQGVSPIANEHIGGFTPPEISRKVYAWFNGGFSHPLSNKVLTYKNFSVTADKITQNKNSYELSKLLLQYTPNSQIMKELALEVFILKKRGLNVEKIYLYMADKNYSAKGELNNELNFEKLFIKEDISRQVFGKVFKIQNAIDFLDHYEDDEIRCDYDFTCEYAHKCLAFIPKYSVMNMTRLSREIKLDLIKQNILNTSEIPDELLTDYQRIQAVCDREKKTHIDAEQLRKFLSKIAYPIHFLDFEAINYIIPPFESLPPNTILPFQFSLCVLESDKSRKKRYDFLADYDKDSRSEIAHLLGEIIADKGSVVAFGSSFEKTIIKELANFCSESREKLLSISARIIDIMTPFEKRWFYHYKMRGSHSLKSVAPAIDKSAVYDGGIANGMKAVQKYFSLFESNAEDRVKIKEELLDYCGKDSEYLVTIYKKLLKAAES